MKFLFAWRYFKSKKSTNVINIIAWISVVAIAVGSAALILVLSVFNGFEGLVKSMYGDFYPDLRVSASHGKYMQLQPSILQKIQRIKDIKNISLTIEEKALLVNGDYHQSIVFLKGVDSNYRNVVAIPKHITADGKYDLGQKMNPALVLGAGIASAIGADLYSTDPLTIFLPNRNSESFSDMQSAMNSFNIRETGIFRIQEDFDNKYAFTNIDFLRYMVELPNNFYSGIAISLARDANLDLVQSELQTLMGKEFKVETRYQQNQGLFSVMQMEKWIIYIILSIILIIAAFNMVGALTMLILEKRKDIAVLKALGANNNFIQTIFLNEGLLLAGIGGLSGMLIAYIICFLQEKFHLLKLEGGSFVVDYYPVKMHVADFVLVGVTIFVVAVSAAWIPAKKASTKEFSLKSGG
ncbi:FtsX-like permease family protein [Arachidicoccus sp.]|uniref:FtsX-like permease family protein n=1 Tax=Arachidicoccus sp. TaxID=1872624 RepID=UPI003D200B52